MKLINALKGVFFWFVVLVLVLFFFFLVKFSASRNRFCHFAKVNRVEFLVTPVMHCLTYTDFCIVSLDSMYLKSI